MALGHSTMSTELTMHEAEAWIGSGAAIGLFPRERQNPAHWGAIHFMRDDYDECRNAAFFAVKLLSSTSVPSKESVNVSNNL
jgi:hypothetical protein